MWKLLGGLAVFTVLLAVACIAIYRLDARILRHDPDTIPDDPRLMRFAKWRGEPTFRIHCASCHGNNGAGDSARGVPDLTDSDWLYGTGSVGGIEQVVAYGIRSYHPKAWNLSKMPAFAHPQPSSSEPTLPPLSPRQIRDVIEYLYTLQHRTADGAAAARGASVYSLTGGCYDCHSADAKGDASIGAPNLADRITLYGNGSRAALFDSIANGRQGICPAWTNVLSAASIRGVALYVFSLSHMQAAETKPDSRANGHVQAAN